MGHLGLGGWKFHFSRRMWLLLALLGLLPVMAWLQYRWIGQVSDAAGQRAKARLENSVEQLITEFDVEPQFAAAGRALTMAVVCAMFGRPAQSG